MIYSFKKKKNASSIGALLVVEWASRLSCNISKACHLEIKYMPDIGRKIEIIIFNLSF